MHNAQIQKMGLLEKTKMRKKVGKIYLPVANNKTLEKTEKTVENGVKRPKSKQYSDTF